MQLRRQAEEARSTFGWESLTEAERQVADLVARGHSNKEIAARLYMSHRTVGSHLYRMFPKLNVRSRVELARLVLERSLAELVGTESLGERLQDVHVMQVVHAGRDSATPPSTRVVS
jgi:DNA-binding CsgD family transcriptional regulator